MQRKHRVAVAQPAAVETVADDEMRAQALAQQFQIVVNCETQTMRERIKFGVMIHLQEQFLGTSGKCVAGSGLKGWWEARAALAGISYETAVSYKILAVKLAEKLALAKKCSQGEALAALEYKEEYQAPAMTAPAKIEDDILAWRDRIMEEYTSKRSLQQYLGGGKAGRPKGSGGAVRGPDTRTPQQKARELWAPAILQLGDNSTLAYVRYLDDEAARQALDVIEHARKLIMERLSTINVG